MKFWGALLLILLSSYLHAQVINGVVIDKFTGLPVPGATVAVGYLATATSLAGKFNISNIHHGDTISVVSIGYKPYKHSLNPPVSDTLTIYLQQVSILLRDVNVKARHDFKLDSIRTRKEFSSIFGYNGLTYKDMFITKNPYVYIPNNYIDAPNSTASIVSVNLLSVIGLLSKNKDQSAKLKRTLVKDEENKYIDRSFSKEKITKITCLKGDSLMDFMAEYRPALADSKNMTDYEMISYIKQSYADFIKTYKKEERSPFRK